MRRLRLSKQCVMSEVKAFFLDQNRYIYYNVMYVYVHRGTGYPWPEEGLRSRTPEEFTDVNK